MPACRWPVWTYCVSKCRDWNLAITAALPLQVDAFQCRDLIVLCSGPILAELRVSMIPSVPGCEAGLHGSVFVFLFRVQDGSRTSLLRLATMCLSCFWPRQPSALHDFNHVLSTSPSSLRPAGTPGASGQSVSDQAVIKSQALELQFLALPSLRPWTASAT